MRTTATVLAMTALLGSMVLAQQSFSRLGVSIEVKPGGEIKVSRDMRQISASGGVHIEAVNKAANTSLIADARKVVVTAFSKEGNKGAVGGLDSIKSAVFDGPVKFVYDTPKPVLDKAGKKVGEVKTTTVATADNATLDGAAGIAYLTGHVRIVQTDPSAFAEPAVMTGDKASINLKRATGAEDYDFKIESTTNPSRIEVVPKPKDKS